MKDHNVFYDNKENNISYGQLRNLYIPIVNKKVVLNSLEFYNACSGKGKLIKILLKAIVYIFGRYSYKLFLSNINYKSIDKSIEDELIKIDGYKYCAILFKENNVNKDYVFQLMDENGKILGYLKYPSNNIRKDFIYNEIVNLNYVNKLNLQSVKVPKVLLYSSDKDIFIQSTMSKLKYDKGKVKENHIKFLNELYSKTNIKYKFEDSPIYKLLINISNETKDIELIELSNEVLNKISINEVEYCYSHGDFYPPNMKWHKNLLYVFDWESGEYNTIYYDLFHYIANEKLTNDEINHNKIIESILSNNFIIDKYEKENKIDKKLRKTMLMLYLYKVIYYFEINLKANKVDDNTIINYIDTLKILLERS